MKGQEHKPGQYERTEIENGEIKKKRSNQVNMRNKSTEEREKETKREKVKKNVASTRHQIKVASSSNKASDQSCLLAPNHSLYASVQNITAIRPFFLLQFSNIQSRENKTGPKSLHSTLEG